MASAPDPRANAVAAYRRKLLEHKDMEAKVKTSTAAKRCGAARRNRAPNDPSIH